MHSATLKTPLLSAPPNSCFTRSSKFNLVRTQSKPKSEKSFKSLKCIHSPHLESNNQNPNFSVSRSAVAETPAETSNLVDNKIQNLVSEFKSLSEPTDRVMRLLHYATRLPPFDDSGRVESNRVRGCTAQVWLEAGMDESGSMRFGADSDSEITKGFCSCLIWMLDGAAPEEVLKLKTEDLAELNVGLHSRTHSRVNTWHTVLISMQKRTKALVEEREREPPSETFSSLVVTADDTTTKGSNSKPQILLSTTLAVDKRLLDELANQILRSSGNETSVINKQS